MQRVKRTTAVVALPAAPAGGTPGYFANPNPGGGVPATIPGYEWFNNVQEEICGVIAAAGLVLDEADFGQLTKAVEKLNQMQAGVISLVGGTADAVTAAYTPAVTALSNGMQLSIRPGAANTTATPTFKADGTAVKTIVKGNNLPLVAGDISGVAHWITLRYDSGLDKWVLLNPATGAATITSTNDAAFVDNSVKPASTNWVRGAMAAIATAAGFSMSLTSIGYIRFPSWLGSWCVQWGNANIGGLNVATTVSLPTTWSSGFFQGLCTASSAAFSDASFGIEQNGTFPTTAINLYNSSTTGTQNIRWIVCGK